jgi:hypothetical protein
MFRDEDMQSLASLMSVNNNDIAPLDDFDDDEDNEGKHNCIVILVFVFSLFFWF